MPCSTTVAPAPSLFSAQGPAYTIRRVIDTRFECNPRFMTHRAYYVMAGNISQAKSPECHTMLFHSRDEGSKCVSMTWRARSSGPDLQDADAISVANGAQAVCDDDSGALCAAVRHHIAAQFETEKKV